MKIKKGWMFVKDAVSNKMVPFFLKVRTEDIISTDQVPIAKALKHTSMKWNQELVSDDVNATVYKFTRNYSGKKSTKDSNGETSTACVENGILYYYLFKDGRATISGQVQISNNERDGSGNDSSSIKTIDLPYAINESYMDSTDWNDAYKVEGDAFTTGPSNPIVVTRMDGIHPGYLGSYVAYEDITAYVLEFSRELFRLNIVDYLNKEIEDNLNEFTTEYIQQYAVDMGIVTEDQISSVTAQNLYDAAKYNILINFRWK